MSDNHNTPDISLQDIYRTSVTDQLNSAYRDQAKCLATYYRELISGGIPDELASHLTIEKACAVTSLAVCNFDEDEL